jgi:hypothetical protein
MTTLELARRAGKNLPGNCSTAIETALDDL